MFNWELLLQIFLITWLFTHHDKISEALDKAYIWTLSKIKKKVIRIILENIHEIISCHKCLSFWTTLIITQNIFAAILISFAAYTLEKNN
jgi:hypothetical protein